MLENAVAPFERVKLLIQSHDDMIKVGNLLTPYKGIVSFWRGNIANVTRYVLDMLVITFFLIV